MAFGAVPPILIEVRGAIGDLKTKMAEAEASVGKMGESASASAKHMQGIGTGLMAVGATATVIGGAITEMGHKLEVAHSGLEVAIKNTGARYDEFSAKVQTAIKHEEHFAHSSADTQSALAILTRATGDTNKSLADMNLVTELAAVHHSSLADAAGIVAKMHGGATKALKEFGINVKELNAPAKEHEKAIKELAAAQKHLEDMQTRLGISAQAAASHVGAATKTHVVSAAGVDSATASLAKAQQHLGDVMAIQSAKTKLTISDHIALRNAQQAVETSTGKVGTAHDKYAAAIDHASTAHAGHTKASGASAMQQYELQKALDKVAEAQKKVGGAAGEGAKAMDFNSEKALIMAKIHGTAAGQADTFGGRMAALKTKIEDFASVAGAKVGPAITMLGPALMGVGGIMTTVVTPGFLAAAGAALPWIAAIAAIAAGAYLLIKYWEPISGFFSGIWDSVTSVFSGAFDWIKSHIVLLGSFLLGGPIGLGLYELVTHWKAIFGGIRDVVVGIWNEITEAVKHGINGIIHGINAFIRALDGVHFSFHMPDWIPGIGGKGFDFNGLNIPTIPTFEYGGRVPGPIGAPMFAVVHGGERVSTPDERGGVTFQITGNTFVGTGGVDQLAEQIRRSLLRQGRSLTSVALA